MRQISLVFALGAAFAASSSHAYTVTEAGDAGQTQATAYATAGGSGALTDVFGSLGSSTDADLFRIDITNAATFSASTNNAAGGFLDTQIFLLTLAGAPVYFNDDADGMSLMSTLPAGNRFGPVAAGSYLLGVAGAGYDPVNLNNQLLFPVAAQGYTTTAVVGPASGLQPAVLGGFFDSTFDGSNFGAYDLKLTGVGAQVPSIPEPTTTALMLVGGALCAGVVRRRRPQASSTSASA